jgi:biotin synthase
MPNAVESDRYERWKDAALSGGALDRDEAADILAGRGIEPLELARVAGDLRQRHHGRNVTIHVLDNVRNGACPEDCGYCGQSKDSAAAIQPYKLKKVDDIVADAEEAQQSGAFRFCMALAGRGPSEAQIRHMCDAISRIKAMGLRTCLSTGLMDEDKARRLQEAGLDRLNHNLNTSRRHYPAICTTHTYDDRVQTLDAAKRAGLGLCCGLIVGMDETHEDILDVAYALREIGAESIPVNFLLPIEGNSVKDPVCEGRPLDPQFCLRVLCLMRLLNPAAEVRIAAGREMHLRSLQPFALYPANSLFMEGYLLTEGQAASDTLQMILDAGFRPVFENPAAVPEELRHLVGSPEGAEGAAGSVDPAANASAAAATLKSSVAQGSGQ